MLISVPTVDVTQVRPLGSRCATFKAKGTWEEQPLGISERSELRLHDQVVFQCS